MPSLTSNGIALDTSADRFGELRESNELLKDVAALQERMRDEGYLFFRGLIPRADVLEARREILLKYAVIGEIDPRHDLMEAVYNHEEQSALDRINLRAFAESVRSGKAYLNVVLHDTVMDFWSGFLEAEVHCYDMRWPRFVRPGEACGFHYDGPYMSRGTERLYTSWIPLGDVKPNEGGLIVLEDSHRSEQLLKTYATKDADADGLEWLDTDPVRLQEQFGGRWLTTEFEAGDVLCFTMHTLHGALDNNSPTRKCRLSSDTRYQPADEARDERWNGDNFEAHGGNMVFFPGLGQWNNQDFQDEWKFVDDFGRLVLKGSDDN